ncbi:hypothetical protein HPB47_006682, partial [Ixodes persulcatus]
MTVSLGSSFQAAEYQAQELNSLSHDSAPFSGQEEVPMQQSLPENQDLVATSEDEGEDAPGNSWIQVLYKDEWNEAVAIAGIGKLNFLVGQLKIEAHHLSPTEDACLGVIHGVRPEFTNEQIRQQAKALGYEVLEAGRFGKSNSAVIVFAGTKVRFT